MSHIYNFKFSGNHVESKIMGEINFNIFCLTKCSKILFCYEINIKFINELFYFWGVVSLQNPVYILHLKQIPIWISHISSGYCIGPPSSRTSVFWGIPGTTLNFGGEGPIFTVWLGRACGKMIKILASLKSTEFSI